MESKPAKLFVEILTDKPTSGKIFITQAVSVAEQTGLSLTWSQTQYLCQHACGTTLHSELGPNKLYYIILGPRF